MASLLPNPRLQFSDANGAPLAGGQLFTYAAGSTTPLASYTDQTGATPATNPVVLDAAGSASIWLGTSLYKIVLTDANGVQQWSVDGVSSVSLDELQGNSSLASLAVSGALTAGSETIAGALTAGSAHITGTAVVDGAATVGYLACNGNAAITGALNVSGASSLGDVTCNGLTASTLNLGTQTLAQYVATLIPAMTTLSGAFVLSAVTLSGAWAIFDFGTTAGTRTRLAFGAGTATNGSSISLPFGFSSSNFFGTCSINAIAASSGNQLDHVNCSLSGLTVTATGSDSLGHSYTGTANWMGFCFLTGY